jgi:hypothetical protein
MAPFESPFANPSAVKKIADDLNRLSTQAVDIEVGVDKAKQEAVKVAQKYQADFNILSKIPSFFDNFAAVIILNLILSAPATNHENFLP